MTNFKTIQYSSIICAIAWLIVLLFAIATSSTQARPNHFYYQPNKFLELTLKDGNVIYINTSMIATISKHSTEEGFIEVRTMIDKYTVKENLEHIKDKLVRYY